MRVTTLIKDYVRKTVAEKMPNPPQPESIERIHSEWDLLRQELNIIITKRVKQFFIDHKGECAPYYCDSDLNDIDTILAYVDKHCDVSLPSNTLTCADAAAHKKACTEMHQKRTETINNILVTLELGGNKADLDAMLANL